MDDLAAFEGLIPPARVAQQPCEPRDAARMMVVDRAGGAPQHHTVRELPR